MSKIVTIATALFLTFTPNIIRSESVNPTLKTTRQIDAFDLVNAAYRGRFKEWGIPAYARLDQAYRGRQITAADLVKAAIEAEHLPAIALENESYINAVDTNLYGLVTR